MMFIIIGICATIYIVSVFIIRSVLVKTEKLNKLDLIFILTPIWNTFLIIGYIVYRIFYYSKQNCIKFKRWFINEK